MRNSYPEYCITKCPVGKLVAEGFLHDCDSAIEAANCMRNFVDTCRDRGCSYTESIDKEPK